MIDKSAVKELNDAIRNVIYVLEGMDDETYRAVSDIQVDVDGNEGRYIDMLDWLQFIGSIH